MTPRCPDMTDSDPVIRTFQCVLDQGHSGPHVPYTPPTVDEWRLALHVAAATERGLREALAYEVGRANRLERELREATSSPCPGCGL